MYDFPSSPTDGQLYQGWVYRANPGAWMQTAAAPMAMTIADSMPANPFPGQMWWESDTGNAFVWFDDGSSQQWVQFNTGTGIVEAPQDSLTYGRRNGAWTKASGWELIATGTAAGVPSIDIPNLSPFRMVRGSGMIQNNASTSGILSIRVSTNNGTSFDTGNVYVIQQAQTSQTVAAGVTSNYTALVLIGTIGIGASQSIGFTFQILNFNTAFIQMVSQASYRDNSSVLVSAYSSGYWGNGTANALQLVLTSGGVITSGSYILEGVRG